uniref:Peptidase S1 domain-containing protein n=1 Tax=Vombatus ursinus TaxID=29139 RepID=A0A4X2LSZ1_VOMUR
MQTYQRLGLCCREHPLIFSCPVASAPSQHHGHSGTLFHVSILRIFVGIVNRDDIMPHTGAVVDKIILHPLFRIHKRRHDYDIALLKLQTPLNFSNTVRAVFFASISMYLFPWLSGALLSPGYGSDTLQNALVPLISPQLCNSSCMYKGKITPQMLCAGYLDGHTDACQVLDGRRFGLGEPTNCSLLCLCPWGL